MADSLPTRTADPGAAAGASVTRSADPLPAPASTPTDIPGYDQFAEIDRGAMGVVYRARQVGLNREVALKVVLHADPKSFVRFLAEAEAIAAVRHPHVVQVYDSGQHAGRPYLAMELCSGGTLARRLNEAGKLTPQAAAELVAKVADGVGAAHAAGVVHRDLKPGNVLFDVSDEPKVADFGLAKRGTGADLTKTDAVMGTPAYMSPEQAGGGTKFVGPPADVWALGVMLYEALLGRRPFDGDGVMAVLDRVRTAEPASMRSVSREVPRELDLIVHKCLAKEPAERYATANELAADLRNWLEGRPLAVKPAGAVEAAVKWVRRNRLLAGATAAVMAALVTGTGVSIAYAVRAEQSAADARKALVERDQAQQKERETVLREFERRQEITAKVIEFVAEHPTLLVLDRGLFIDEFHDRFPDISKAKLIRTITTSLVSAEWETVPITKVGTRAGAAGASETFLYVDFVQQPVRHQADGRLPTSPVATLTGFAPMTKNLADIERADDAGARTASSFNERMFSD